MNNGMNTQLKQGYYVTNRDYFAASKNKAAEDIYCIVPEYTGSNGYTVGIYITTFGITIFAVVTTPENKQLQIPASRIVSGLDGALLNLHQLITISSANPNAFRAIYLAETQKVYIWPNMKGAGIGDNLMMNNNQEVNPFIGKNLTEVRDMIFKPGVEIHNPEFKIPSTNKTVAEVGGFLPGKREEAFYSKDRSVTVHFDRGIDPQGKYVEPPHVGVNVWTAGASQQVKTNYPIDPNDRDWNRVAKIQKVIDKDPQNTPVPKPKKPNDGDGNKGGNSGPAGGTKAKFHNDVTYNDLTDSCNATNSRDPVPKGNAGGEIGGVAIHDPNAIMLNLHDSLYDLTARGYWLTFPLKDGTLPFSNRQLQQIVRELAQTIYIHNNFPFYSLHFTKEGTLYSIIHPAYQNTLVGKVIAMLDYFMKGYLNGGYFDERDLERFAKNKAAWINDYDKLKPAIHSIEDISLTEFPDEEYISLSQLIEQYQIKQYNMLDRLLGNDEIKKIEQRFQISFRIIAKEDSIEKAADTLLFNGSFDVFYTIELHKSAIGDLDKYKESDEYEILDYFCRHVAKDIKEKLPKLEICKTYFAMLEVICGVSYYFGTLKRHELMPSFTPIEIDNEDKCLGIFPPYPKTKLAAEIVKHTLWDFLQKLNNSNKFQLKQYLTSKTNQVSPELQSSLAAAIKEMLPTNAVKMGADKLNELTLLLLNSALASINRLKEETQSKKFNQHLRELDEIITTAQDNINKAKDNLSKLRADFDKGSAIITQRKQQNITEQIQNIERQKTKVLKELQESKQKQEAEINQVKIPDGNFIVFDNKPYTNRNEKELESAMRTKLNEQIQKNTRDIENETAKMKRTATSEIEAHWSKNQVDLANEYKRNQIMVNQQIEKIETAKKEMEKERGRLYRLKHMDDPTKQEFAKEIELGIPSITKNLSTLGFKDNTLVRVNGGTGFKLTNLELSNTALANSLSGVLSNKASNFPAQSSVGGNSEAIETWQQISFNNQRYQAFYLSHDQDNEAGKKELENSLQKPRMAKTDDEKMLLQLAAQKPSPLQLEKITHLIMNANESIVSKTDAYGNTLLHLAAMNNNVDLIKLLSKHNGFCLNQLNQFGNSPLHVAAMYGHDACVVELCKQDKNIVKELTMNDESALYLAVLHHNLSTVKLLVNKYGLDINEVGVNGLPLIYTALFNDSLEITQYLLNAPSIKLDFQLENGNTLLHLAVRLNHLSIAHNLIKRGLDLELYNKNGKSAIHIAVELGYLDMVEAILGKNKALLNQPDSSGSSPLHLAIKYGHEAICNYLLNMDADFTSLVNGGNALTRALQYRQVACIEMILAKQFNYMKLADPVELSNFHMICKLGLWEIAKSITMEDPNALTKILFVIEDNTANKNHLSTEPTCYIDYLCTANAYSQFENLLKTQPLAAKYVKQNLEKIYQIAIRFAAEEILSCLVKAKMIPSNHQYDTKIVINNNLGHPLYKNYDLIQYACRHNISSVYNPYLARPDIDIERITPDNKNLAYLAAESGNQPLLERLIKGKGQLYAPNGRHIFYALVSNNQTDIIRHLVLNYGMDINMVIDKDSGMRAIDLACRLGNIDTIMALIACGGEIDKTNSKNRLAIHYAIENNAVHVVRLLFKYDLGGLEHLMEFAILRHKNSVFSQILKHNSGFRDDILACSKRLFQAAIKAENLNAVKLLLGLGAKPDSRILHLAVKFNQPKILKLLLNTNVDINAIDQDGNTVLHLACRYSHNDNDLIIIELLKHKNLNQAIVNKDGKLAKDLAGKWKKQIVLANNLLSINMHTIAKELVEAIKAGDLVKLKERISRYNIPVNLRIMYTHNAETADYSLLEIAILEGKKNIISYLLGQKWINPLEINPLGLTAVHLLMKHSDAEFAVDIIKQFNLDIQISNPANGITPLHFAMLIKNPALIAYLITNGANIYAETIDNQTVMDFAIEHKSLDLVKALIEEHGYDIHHKSSILESPLAIALKKGNLIIAEYLIRRGANIFAIDGFKLRTMLHYAVMSQDIKVVHYVLTLGINERLKDDMQMLPLHLAAKQGNIEIVELLSKANPSLLWVKDIRGRDANDFALIHRKTEASTYISKRYGNVFKDKPTLDNVIRFKKYRLGDRTQLELAMLAEDQANIGRLIVAVDPNDSNTIEQIICTAGANANPQIFAYVLNQLWDGKNHQLIRKCMMNAIVNNKPANLRELLSIVGSDVVFDDGSTALELACKYNAPEALRCMLDYNQENYIEVLAKHVYLALKYTIDNNSISQARMICENCSDSNWQFHVDSNGNSLLYHAVLKNKPQLLALFIMYGCIDQTNHVGIGAYDLATKNNNIECIKYLTLGLASSITDNPVVNKNQENNRLIKYLETENGSLDYDVLRWLCSFQDINAIGAGGKTPLQLLIERMDIRAIEILLTNSSNLSITGNWELVFKDLYLNNQIESIVGLRNVLGSLNLLNVEEHKLFFEKIINGNVPVYALLLHKDFLSKLGTNNVLNLALDCNEIQLCNFLIGYGKVLDTGFKIEDTLLKDKSGNTLIHRAIMLNHTELLENILINLKMTNINIENADGFSPSMLALVNGQQKNLELLNNNLTYVENTITSVPFSKLKTMWQGKQELTPEVMLQLSNARNSQEFFMLVCILDLNELDKNYETLIDNMQEDEHKFKFIIYLLILTNRSVTDQIISRILEKWCDEKKLNNIVVLREVLSSFNLLHLQPQNNFFNMIKTKKISIYQIFLYQQPLSQLNQTINYDILSMLNQANSSNLLHIALKLGEVKLFQFLIESHMGLKVNIIEWINGLDEERNSIIHLVTLLNYPELLTLLLNKFTVNNLMINNLNQNGLSPVVLAMCLNHHKCFQILIEHGATVESTLHEIKDYNQLKITWRRQNENIKKATKDEISQIASADNLNIFFEMIMKFSLKDLSENYEHIIPRLSQKLNDVNWIRYFMMIVNKTNTKDLYNLLNMWVTILPVCLQYVKLNDWHFFNKSQLLNMIYTNDNPKLFKYMLGLGHNPHPTLKLKLVLPNNNLKITPVYDEWFKQKSTELEKKVNSTWKSLNRNTDTPWNFSDIRGFNELFNLILNSYDFRSNAARVYKSEQFWIDISIWLIIGMRRLNRISPYQLIADFKQFSDSDPYWVAKPSQVKDILDKLQAIQFIADAIAENERSYTEYSGKDCHVM